jgi:hypothetical protein
MATITRVPFTLETLAIVVPLLKSAGYVRRTGLKSYVAAFATAQAFTAGSPLAGTLKQGQTFKWLNAAERSMLNAVWDSTPQAVATATRKASRKASGKATVRRCKAGNHSADCQCGFGFPKSGKATPQAVATPQASGKVDTAELAATLANVADTLATLATKLAS